MDRFVRELMSMPALDAADERALARRARTGDRSAREALITSGLRSVALRARMLGMQGEELRDAVQSGTIGLIRAVDRFDPDRGVRLATYAWQWIGAEMRPPHHREAAIGPSDPPSEEARDDGTGWLDGLDELGADVLRRRFALGVDNAFPLSRRAVGQQLGLTVSQVRTVEAKAMRQLREGLAKVVDRAPVQPGADPP